MASFPAEDFAHTAHVLRTESDAVVKATLSNNFAIILNALDIASGYQNDTDIALRDIKDRFDRIDALLSVIAANLGKIDALLARVGAVEADLVALRKQVEDRI